MAVKEKPTLSVGILVPLIIGLMVLSVTSLQTLTATESTSPMAGYGPTRALILLLLLGGLSIATGVWMLLKLLEYITHPFRKLTKSINEIANHNYDTQSHLHGGEAMEQLSTNFNQMACRLHDYHNSSLSKLKMSKQYIEAIIDSIDEPIVCLDHKLTLYFINNEALSIFNLRRENAAGKSVQETATCNDLLRRLLVGMYRHEVHETDERKTGPLKTYADNKESYLQVKHLPVRMTDREGSIKESNTVIMSKNITEFRKLDAAKTTFISTISHELKTSISAILMSEQLLANNRVGGLNQEQKELSNSTHENGERLLSITGELLDMIQVESGVSQLKPYITRLTELIDCAIKANQAQADKLHISIEVDYLKGKVNKLYVDSEKIAWALTNLLSNVIWYSSENDRVAIGALQQNKHHIMLYVQDFGRGIDPRYHGSIFERYFRVPGTKIQGSGPGLSISRGFVEAHNGILTVEGELDKGSKFVVSLPVQKDI